MVRVGGFEPPVSCFQGRRGRPDSPTPCFESASGWTSRQDSNLHQSAFVVRCSSIELREELVCLAGGFPALTSRLDAFGRRHRAVDRTSSVSSSYPALKASKAVTGCLTFWRTRNSSMIPKAGVARGARGKLAS
jgi:hypothetical protein